MGASETLLEFRRMGGSGGNDERLVVTDDGHATLHGPGGAREIELGPATLSELRRELDAARLGELPEDLRRPPRADEPQPDVVEYALTAGGHTVRALGSALPPQLLAVVETLNVAISRETTQGEA